MFEEMTKRHALSGQDNNEGEPTNDPTCLALIPPSPTSSPQRAEDLFLQVYPRLYRQLCLEARWPGQTILVAAVHKRSQRLRRLYLRHVSGGGALQEEEMDAWAVLGRHSETDLRLGDEDIALRHLLLHSYLDEEGNTWTQVLDLRSQSGLYDHEGRRCVGLTSPQSLSFSVGHYFCWVLPIQGKNWPAHPHQAWRMIQEQSEDSRVMVNPLVLLDDNQPALLQKVPAQSANSSESQREERGWWASPVCEAVKERASFLAGTLSLGEDQYAISEEILRDGLILGRYCRCDFHPLFHDDDKVSRLHLLLLLWDGALWAIDLASTNGTFLLQGDGSKESIGRARRLKPGMARFKMGKQIVTWTPGQLPSGLPQV